MPRLEITAAQQTLHGTPSAAGIGIGHAYILLDGRTVVPQYQLARKRDAVHEIRRFDEALERVRERLRSLKSSLTSAAAHDALLILQVNLELLDDPHIREATIKAIEHDQINAEAAFHRATQEILAVFAQIQDDYLKTRGEDIKHLEARVLSELLGAQKNRPRGPGKDNIVVAHSLGPDEAIELAQVPVAGIVTETGSRVSHAAIIARTFGIPSITGVEGACEKLTPGRTLIVDGGTGVVILNPVDAMLRQAKRRQNQQNRRREKAREESSQPAITKDGFRVHFYANIDLPEEVSQVHHYGAEGIGLYRTEYLFLNRDQPPSLDELEHHYGRVVKKLKGLPVTFRTMDLGGDKLPRTLAFPVGENPALGLRGIRYSLKTPELFDRQITALVRTAKLGPLRIMIPMVTSHEELAEARARITAVQKAEKAEAVPVGVMIETPSSVMIADILARDADFFSLGTNDLIQYGLAIDRGNEHVSHLYAPLHPAILRMIRHVAQIGHDAGIEVGICGELAGDPLLILVLLGLGIDTLSMSPSMIPRIHAMVRRSNLRDAQFLNQAIFALHDIRDIEATIRRRLEDDYLDLL